MKIFIRESESHNIVVCKPWGIGRKVGKLESHQEDNTATTDSPIEPDSQEKNN